MGNMMPNQGGRPNQQSEEQKRQQQQRRQRQQQRGPQRVGRKKKLKGTQAASKLPAVTPSTRCRLRKLRLDRIKD